MGELMRLFETILEANHRAIAGDMNAGLHSRRCFGLMTIAVETSSLTP